MLRRPRRPRPDPADVAAVHARLSALLRGEGRATPVAVPSSPSEPDPGSAATPPMSRSSPRASLTPPATSALLAVALIAVALTFAWGWHTRAHPVSTSTPAPTALPTTFVAPSPTPSTAVVIVDVSGRVRHPGLVTLPAGSRVADAIASAGGPLRGAVLGAINLARVLVDGEQIVVPRRGAPPATTGPGIAIGPIDLNVAGVDDLDGLPGIGPVLAQRIVDYRTAHGPFASVDDLANVSGIGAARLADLRDLVRV